VIRAAGQQDKSQEGDGKEWIRKREGRRRQRVDRERIKRVDSGVRPFGRLIHIIIIRGKCCVTIYKMSKHIG
jgi:hypothetical protein